MIKNGQPANETSFNSAFLSRTEDNDIVKKLYLVSEDVDGADAVLSAQERINLLEINATNNNGRLDTLEAIKTELVFGGAEVDGSFRIIISEGAALFQFRLLGEWTTKFKVNP